MKKETITAIINKVTPHPHVGDLVVVITPKVVEIVFGDRDDDYK